MKWLLLFFSIVVFTGHLLNNKAAKGKGTKLLLKKELLK